MIAMDYQKILVKLRKEKGLKQEEFAPILGISRKTYSHFESQYDIIPIKHLDTISSYFNVSISYILGFEKKRIFTESRNVNLELSATRLKEIRKELALTQKELASIVGTTQSVINGYEKSKCFIKTAFLYKLCQKYKVNPDYLLGKVDEPKYYKK